jgi:hypothetical protein
MVQIAADTDPQSGAPARGYRNWTEHPNNPMARLPEVAG